jgi:catechol 2,3-dioxygenase-like lactoylglutathione lyase family enzyme
LCSLNRECQVSDRLYNNSEIKMTNEHSSIAAPGPTSKVAGTPPSPIKYIHHLKFPVADVDKSVTFYEQVFGAQEQSKLTHRDPATKDVYAKVVRIPGFQPMVELWRSTENAQAQAGYDFLTLAVNDRAALDSWSIYLDELGVEHSDVLTAIDSWLLVFEDPDGHRMRLYSLEEHPITHDFSTDPRWLDPI